MTDEKQIEEMAFDICVARKANYSDGCRVCSKNESCLYQDIAYDLYRAGYRKQSEWISVEERLPDNRKFVIVCDKYGNVGEAYHRAGRFEWVDDEEVVEATHWMPLPEPPKMKGGE